VNTHGYNIIKLNQITFFLFQADSPMEQAGAKKEMRTPKIHGEPQIQM